MNDLFYLQHRTLRLDLWVLVRTTLKMVGIGRRITLAAVPASAAPDTSVYDALGRKVALLGGAQRLLAGRPVADRPARRSLARRHGIAGDLRRGGAVGPRGRAAGAAAAALPRGAGRAGDRLRRAGRARAAGGRRGRLAGYPHRHLRRHPRHFQRPAVIQPASDWAPDDDHASHFIASSNGDNGIAVDFVQDRFRATELFRRFYVPLGIETQLSIQLPAPEGIVVGISVTRGAEGFDARDRALLDALRPHLARAYRVVQLSAQRSTLGSVLADDGWGTGHLDRRQEKATFGPSTGIRVSVEGDTLVTRFSVERIGGADVFRWSAASEWGSYESMASSTSARDHAPDDGAVDYPG